MYPTTDELTLPSLGAVLARFDAVAVLDLPTVGATLRFGTQDADGQIWSVDVETLQGTEIVGLARTFRDVDGPAHQDGPSLCTAELASFAAQAMTRSTETSVLTREEQMASTRRFSAVRDICAAEANAATWEEITLSVRGVPVAVPGRRCRDYVGAHTTVGGCTVVLVLPTRLLDGSGMSVIAAAR